MSIHILKLPLDIKTCVRHHGIKTQQGVSYLEVQKIEKNINDHDHNGMPIRPGTTLSALGAVPHPFPTTLKGRLYYPHSYTHEDIQVEGISSEYNVTPEPELFTVTLLTRRDNT